MKLEVLLSCMHQEDLSLVERSRLTGDVLIINQCDREAYAQQPTQRGLARQYSVTQRGLTRSRNLAIAKARGDVCLLCDDDEVFAADYEERILEAYAALPQADVVIFKMINRPASFPDKVQQLRFPKTLKVSSWQISFRRQRLLDTGVAFDPLLGAGSGNGAEEELKFLTDCQRAGLRIYYVPVEIASVGQEQSTWFQGFTRRFFFDRGATTRYILGLPLASLYALYYVLRKHSLYRQELSLSQALGAIFQGIWQDPITKQSQGCFDKE